MSTGQEVQLRAAELRLAEMGLQAAKEAVNLAQRQVVCVAANILPAVSFAGSG